MSDPVKVSDTFLLPPGEITAWGQPWHGSFNTIGETAIFTLDNGSVKPGAKPPTDAGTHFVGLGMLDAQTPADLDAAGGKLLADAVLFGWEKRISPLADQPAVGRDYCLARDDDGALWRIKVTCIGASAPPAGSVHLKVEIVGRWGLIGQGVSQVAPRVMYDQILEIPAAQLRNGTPTIGAYMPALATFLASVHLGPGLREALVDLSGTISQYIWPHFACAFAARLKFSGAGFDGLIVDVERLVDQWASMFEATSSAVADEFYSEDVTPNDPDYKTINYGTRTPSGNSLPTTFIPSYVFTQQSVVGLCYRPDGTIQRWDASISTNASQSIVVSAGGTMLVDRHTNQVLSDTTYHYAQSFADSVEVRQVADQSRTLRNGYSETRDYKMPAGEQVTFYNEVHDPGPGTNWGMASGSVSRRSINTWSFFGEGTDNYLPSAAYNVNLVIGPTGSQSFGAQSINGAEWSFDPRSLQIIKGVRM